MSQKLDSNQARTAELSDLPLQELASVLAHMTQESIVSQQASPNDSWLAKITTLFCGSCCGLLHGRRILDFRLPKSASDADTLLPCAVKQGFVQKNA